MQPDERFRVKAAGVAAAGLEYGNETLIEAIAAALADAVETERRELQREVESQYHHSIQMVIDARPKVRE
jgi:hypothetical protein